MKILIMFALALSLEAATKENPLPALENSKEKSRARLIMSHSLTGSKGCTVMSEEEMQELKCLAKKNPAVAELVKEKGVLRKASSLSKKVASTQSMIEGVVHGVAVDADMDAETESVLFRALMKVCQPALDVFFQGPSELAVASAGSKKTKKASQQALDSLLTGGTLAQDDDSKKANLASFKTKVLGALKDSAAGIPDVVCALLESNSSEVVSAVTAVFGKVVAGFSQEFNIFHSLRLKKGFNLVNIMEVGQNLPEYTKELMKSFSLMIAPKLQSLLQSSLFKTEEGEKVKTACEDIMVHIDVLLEDEDVTWQDLCKFGKDMLLDTASCCKASFNLGMSVMVKNETIESVLSVLIDAMDGDSREDRVKTLHFFSASFHVNSESVMWKVLTGVGLKTTAQIQKEAAALLKEKEDEECTAVILEKLVDA